MAWPSSFSLVSRAAGESVCPYHYELTEEEWLIVLDGRPTLRTPEGDMPMARPISVSEVSGEKLVTISPRRMSRRR